MLWISQSQQLSSKSSNICIQLVGQITDINLCKQELVPQKKLYFAFNKTATADV